MLMQGRWGEREVDKNEAEREEQKKKVRMEEEEDRVERGISELKPQIMEKIKRLFCEAE